MEIGWLAPPRRKIFKRPPEKKRRSSRAQKNKKPYNLVKASWTCNWPKARTFWLRSEQIMELSTKIVDSLVKDIQFTEDCKIEHYVKISKKYHNIKFFTVNSWHSSTN